MRIDTTETEVLALPLSTTKKSSPRISPRSTNGKIPVTEKAVLENSITEIQTKSEEISSDLVSIVREDVKSWSRAISLSLAIALSCSLALSCARALYLSLYLAPPHAVRASSCA